MTQEQAAHISTPLIDGWSLKDAPLSWGAGSAQLFNPDEKRVYLLSQGVPDMLRALAARLRGAGIDALDMTERWEVTAARLEAAEAENAALKSALREIDEYMALYKPSPPPPASWWFDVRQMVKRALAARDGAEG